MVLAHHIIFGMYGFWLPNDPRGSWSDFVGAWELFRYGRATKTPVTHSLARRSHDAALRLDAKKTLKRPSCQLSGVQARAVARGFGRYAGRAKLQIYACAILPDHVHLVFGRHRLGAEQLVTKLKAAATTELQIEGLHPFGSAAAQGRTPKCFARGQWDVYLDSIGDVRRAIRYVEENPVKEGKRRQKWSFVTGHVG
jgi:REP element-mobilizing transposase RayT